ncbi:MAG TPA: thioesterase, partial [Bacteroidia bacterium]|nr:thioesterase [Bacteroidia bacterium]
GVLAMMYVYGASPRVSMLVTGMKATFSKKAVGRVQFTCMDGKAIANAIAETQRTGDGVTINATSVGKDEQGDVIAEFVFEWSFKKK